MDTIFHLIPVAEAIARFHIDENIYESREMFEDFVREEDHFYLHEGDLILDVNFILDTDNLSRDIHGYIITGNLVVNGCIINDEGDYGPALYVTGDVLCRSLLIGGSPTHITGNVTAEEVIMLHYNHGWMKCPGIFTTPVMIVEDYHFVPASKNISGFYYNDHDPVSPVENECFEDEEDDWHISERLQVLLNNKLTTTFEELRRDLAAGEYVLRPVVHDKEYWLKKINVNYRDLKRTPEELRTKDLCMLAMSKTVAALQHFPLALVTAELAQQAVQQDGKALRYLPESFVTRDLCYAAALKGAMLNWDIPERFYEEELLQLIIRHSDFQMEHVPATFITEDLLVTYVKAGRGAWLDKYCSAAGISKAQVLQRVIDDGVEYLQNIFGWHFSTDTYAYAKARYDNNIYSQEWKAITEQYKRKLERL
ncbi:MAG TPA: polymer-forming cytoskeletal protein [Chitinophaga sp.]|uniref:polymer-forming cytoskeletal protein n=1 Tax=Chitinophaga sp. TaxID=1869181 RepID=UPI002BAD3522|nr:polymer-forming cytoskeletal protein [Chitinophaga sp.]HVI44052.1 polymer-forming cytoskeletal protein [Chitinophaga sp.]